MHRAIGPARVDDLNSASAGVVDKILVVKINTLAFSGVNREVLDALSLGERATSVKVDIIITTQRREAMVLSFMLFFS